MSQRELGLELTLKDNATKQLNGVNSTLQGMEPTFKKMAAAGTVAFAAVLGAIGKTVRSAVNLGESINAVNVVFGDGADKVLEFGKNAAKAVGLSNSSFNQMATITGALLKDTGLSMGEVADKTIELTKRAADMASVFNTDVSDAMSAINQAIRGETEAIRRYAGDVTDATLEQYLLSKGIKKSVTELTAQEKRLYRVQLIMHQTDVTANDFQNTIDSLANKKRVLAAQTENISAKLGSTFIPIISEVLKKIEPLVEKFAKWAEENPTLVRNIALAVLAITGLVSVLGILGLVLISVAAAFNPIGLVIMGIIAIIALFGAAWASNFANIREITMYMIGAIKSAWEGWGQHSMGHFKAVWEFITGVFRLALNTIQTIIAAFYLFFTGKWGALWELIKGSTKSSLDIIKNSFSNAWEAVKSSINGISSYFTQKFEDMWNKAKQVAEKIRHAISSAFDKDKKNSPSIVDMLNSLNSTVTHKLQDINVGASEFAMDARHAIGSGFVAPAIGASSVNAAGGQAVTVTITGNTFLDQQTAEKVGDLVIRKLKLNYQQ